MRQARTCGRVQAPGPTPTCLQVLQNSHVSGHRMFMSRVKTLSGACQREIAVDKIREKKNYRECIYITTRTAWQCTVTGSVPRKMAKGRQRILACCENRTNVERLTKTCLHHSDIGSYQCTVKNSIWLVMSRKLEQIFCVQECRSRIAQCSSWISRPDTIYQNSWQQTLYRYMLSYWT